MPETPTPPDSPLSNYAKARVLLADADRGWGEAPAEQGALLRAVTGAGYALLAVAEEIATTREQGVYRAGDGR